MKVVPVTPTLAEEGWVSPERPGPTRRVSMGSVLLVLPMLAWILALQFAWAPAKQVYEVRIDDEGRGTARIAQDAEDRRAEPVTLETELRTDQGASFLVVSGSVDEAEDDARVRVVPPAGVATGDVAARIAPRADGSGADLVVAIPADAVPGFGTTEPAGSLDELTDGVDARGREAVEDGRLLDRLRDRWWWMAALGLAGSIGAPLLLWRRARRRFFSMRRPGPGKDLDSTPPSSLDPVGAAVLVAGARPVDATAAFAGHVLDLVERRQLQMRRTKDPAHGVGVLIGLGHAEELEDVAVEALRTAVLEDEITVAVPDAVTRMRPVSDGARLDWHVHVAARARFERMVDIVDLRRHVVAAALLALAAIIALAVGATAHLDGRRALAFLLVALLVPMASLVAAWALDARRWRIVTRARRLERAQWLAWRGVVGTPNGPALDPRSLAVIAATGSVTDGLRASTGADAVGLAAVTTRTVETLRLMVARQDR